MKMLYKLPNGTQDYIGKECYNKSLAEDKLLKCFYMRGYNKIETPAMEYLDMFTGGYGAVSDKNLFTITDSDGSILALRQDMTVPISRVVATKMENEALPIRLCYCADSYARQGSYLKTREYSQCGIELIGNASALADVEAISLSIESLLALNIDNFKLDIGHVDFLKGILEELGISRDLIEELTQLIDKKDRLAIELFTLKIGLDDWFSKLLYRLPVLFGGIEVISEARQYARNATSIKALDRLAEIYEMLADRGLDKYVSIDLGLAKQMNFYTGVTFKAITAYCGSPLLSGGRYDTLCHSYNKYVEAIGFAVGLKNILITLDRMDKLTEDKSYDLAIGYYTGGEKLANMFIDDCIKKGISVVNTFINDEKEFYDKLKLYNARKGTFIKNEGDCNE